MKRTRDFTGSHGRTLIIISTWSRPGTIECDGGGVMLIVALGFGQFLPLYIYITRYFHEMLRHWISNIYINTLIFMRNSPRPMQSSLVIIDIYKIKFIKQTFSNSFFLTRVVIIIN